MLLPKVQSWVVLGPLCIGAALCTGSLPSVPAKEGPPNLELQVARGKLIRSDLREGESQEHKLPLAPGEVVDVTVEQDGIDVSLILSRSDHEVLLALDSPTGTRGTEHLFAIADVDGIYRLRIQAATGRASGIQGRYVLRLREPRPAEPRDRFRARATQEYSRGEDFRRRSTDEDRRRALVHYGNALHLWQVLGDTAQQIIVHHRRSRIFQDLGELPAASDAYHQALSLTQDPLGRVALLNYLAVLYARQGDVPRALQAGEQALELASRTGDLESHAAALNNLGMVYRSWGENDRALDYFDASLDKWQEVGPHHEMAKALGNRAEVLLVIGSPKPAIVHLREALRVQTELGDRDGEGYTYRLLGVAFDQLGVRSVALKFLEQARERAHATGNRWVEALALNDTGSALLELGEIHQAGMAFSDAGRIAREGGNPDNEAYAMAGLGKVLLEQGDGAGAIERFARSEELYEQLGDPNALAMVLYGSALAERSLGRIEDSLTSIGRALALVESLREDLGQRDLRIHLIGARADLYDLKVDLLLRLHQRRPDRGYDADAFAASEWRRARSLLETVKKMGAGIPQTLSREALRRQGVLRKRLQELAREKLRSGRRDLPALDTKIREALAEWEALSEEIRRQSPGYAAVTEPKLVNAREVQELLDADTALIAYTLGEERSILWWIEKNALEVHQDLRPRAELEPVAFQAYDLMSRPPRTKQRRLEQDKLEQLGEILLGPIAERLGRVRRLVVVADEALQILPFAALPVPGSGEPLVESHAVVQLPSASLAAALRSRQKERATPPQVLAVFADPVFGPAEERSLARLPHSLREADGLLKLVPAGKSRRFVGFEANRHTAMDPDLARYRYIHFATHGLVDLGNPNLSGIQLSRIDPRGRPLEGDGILRFFEVYNLSLPADLVTLSACRSAVGPQVRGEGPLGMSRSFLYAGASRVLGALWDVDDADAADLMTLFYQALLRNGESPSIALQNAQKAMRARGKRNAPYHWAGFVLQGDWP